MTPLPSGNNGRRLAATVAATIALLTAAGCAGFRASSPESDARAATSPTPRAALPSSPFGEIGGESPARAAIASVARPEPAGSGVRPTAWSKIKGVISRTPPSAIPLPAPTDNAERDAPETTSDARDF